MGGFGLSQGQRASLVQLVERRSPKPDVEGSSPSRRVFQANIGVNGLNLRLIFLRSCIEHDVILKLGLDSVLPVQKLCLLD